LVCFSPSISVYKRQLITQGVGETHDPYQKPKTE
jgi:hypothetical protein